jgi:predicted secreted Zn-dependent protease
MAVINFDTLVNWSQFSQLSARPSDKDEDAQISQQVSFSNFNLERKNGKLTIKDVDVRVSLVDGECWVVSNQMSDALLKHEQGHYDILALSARALYKALVGQGAATATELQQKALRLQASFGAQATTVNDRYDTQTNHSRNTTAQQLWNTRISEAKLNPQATLDNLPT